MSAPIPPYLLAYLHQHVPPPIRHLIDPDATLSELMLGTLARTEMAVLIEDEHPDSLVPDAVAFGWKTIGDVVKTEAALLVTSRIASPIDFWGRLS